MNTTWMARWWHVVVVLAVAAVATAKEEPVTFSEYLKLNEIDQPRREALASATEWNDAAEAVAVKVLRRFDAPPHRAAKWEASPAPRADKGEAIVVIDDALHAIRGRATCVAPHRLTGELAERYGAAAYDVVRVVDEGGLVVDVITPAAPAAWPRWKTIDESVLVLGLPLSSAVAPRPNPAADREQEWPADQPDLLVAASHVAWYPETPLGRLGMDYALFDSVVDGKKLVKGDTAAFYAMLTAAGATNHKDIAAAAGTPIDVMLLIDPGRKWLPSHRGDPVVFVGDAMKATRVTIDDPAIRKLVGSNHYWEIFVFVETALLEIEGHIQNSYPIVCCVRELPEGMPSGDRINERVEIAGFALKRYAYPFEDTRPNESGEIAKGSSQRYTTLVLGPKLKWFPAPAESNTQPIWLIAAVAALVALAAIVGVGLLYGNRSIDRAIQKSRDEFPERVELPSGESSPDGAPAEDAPSGER